MTMNLRSDGSFVEDNGWREAAGRYEAFLRRVHGRKVLFLEMEMCIRDRTYPVIHINTTFEMMANAIRDVIADRDYEMQDVLDDYLNYCYKDGLIPVSDSWKYLRMQLAGTTLDFNVNNNVYYDNAERGFRAHDYLGLYKQKSVRAIGKICARITAIETEEGIKYTPEFGELTEGRKQMIAKAMEMCIRDRESSAVSSL